MAPLVVLGVHFATQIRDEIQKLRAEINSLKDELRRSGLIAERVEGPVKVASPEL